MGKMIIDITDDLVEDVKTFWDMWTESPAKNMKLLISINNKLLSAIVLAENYENCGHKYVLERSSLTNLLDKEGKQ
jgi:hypothetical protein